MWLAFPTITLPWEGSGLGQAGQAGALGTCLQGPTAAPCPGGCPGRGIKKPCKADPTLTHEERGPKARTGVGGPTLWGLCPGRWAPQTSTGPGALWAQACLWGFLTLSFPPFSAQRPVCPSLRATGDRAGTPLAPLGGGAGRQAGRRRDTGVRHLWRSKRPGGVGRERRPVRRTQDGAGESVTQGMVRRVCAKLAEQTPEPGVRGQGDVAGGPCGPPLPFLEKACFPGQNPTPDPPPQGRTLRAARWSWRPAPPLSPSPGPAIR